MIHQFVKIIKNYIPRKQVIFFSVSEYNKYSNSITLILIFLINLITGNFNVSLKKTNVFPMFSEPL